MNTLQVNYSSVQAKEIGRRALSIEGSISANNFVQIPHPSGTLKSLGLTGRYFYFQVKCPRHGLPFSYHIDLGMAERSHGIRISLSNLFKNFNTSNGFVAQVPLELKHNCWTVVVLDIFEILKKSSILPPTYLIDGSYQIRSVNVCANTHIRGIFTSDNLYDFVTLPADLRFKFSFDLPKWPEYFDWQCFPHDWNKPKKTENGDLVPGDENQRLQNVIDSQKSQKKLSREDQRTQMRKEIDGLLAQSQGVDKDDDDKMNSSDLRKQKYDEMQRQLDLQFNAAPGDHPIKGYIVKEEDDPVERQAKSKRGDYRSGQYSGYELSRSHKLSKDPIMELKHIIGYQPSKCLNIKWARMHTEANCVVFTSGGTLISMNTENNQQKRFFFGHSAPICCFDINQSGTLLASAQEGKNSIIRIWDYATARCLTMVTMPVVSLKCLSFSHDGRFLASVGKDSHNKELIYIWDISRVQKGDKPDIVARQTSEFNILSLKFSPIDSTRLASCGKENIRFWRIRETGNIRGSAVVLNHHARDTVFTSLDFEYGFQSADKKEDEALKRVFVGSKSGTIYQINYQTETLEANYKVNDGAIYSVAVNEAFCVTGSEDNFLRVWPLDFQEFFMEAQHEGTVCAVDISPDGLKVVCGTLNGSIGILDKSNQNYKTLLRSHTDDILCLDFHLTKHNIITASRDRTIRLWDIDTFDEVYEFSSPVDQPLCISAHPTLPIFACGFESGKMRIFDIDTTEVQDEFSQFNKPLSSLKYDNFGNLLIACCADGSVAIHNSKRQHLPIKMMHLQMPPEFAYVAFSEKSMQLMDGNQKFAIVGENGNNVIVYDTDSFLIQHQISVTSIVRSFRFANNNRDLLVITKDSKIKFYSLMKYEGIFLREISNCHRAGINHVDVSSNSGFFLTGGEDSILKVWDYEAQRTVPYYFQSFIGHTFPISSVIFNPNNNAQVISASTKDGIYIWEFNGDIENDYKAVNLAGQDLQSHSTLDEQAPSMLEKIRTTYKAKKAFRNQMSEDTFVLPTFKPLEQLAIENNNREYIETCTYVKQQRMERKLAFNHYANCSKVVDVDVDNQSIFGGLTIGDGKSSTLELKLVNGYDGFGGVHDNLVWSVQAGFTYFTLNNKVIIENTKTRQQSIFADSCLQLSCLAVSNDGKYLAAGEGSENEQGNSQVFLYDLEKRKLLNKLTFHIKGIQSIAFSLDSRYLISVGVQGENSLAVWDINSGLVIQKAVLGNYCTNQVRVDRHVEGSHVQFVTVGNNASLTIWRLDTDLQQLTFFDVSVPQNLLNINFLTVDFTDHLPAPVDTYYILVGADDGSMIAYDLQKQSFVDLGKRGRVVNGEVTGMSVKNNTIVVAGSTGTIAHFPIVGSDIQPESPDFVDVQRVESGIVAISMDEQNNEGLIGTEAGCIHYVNFQEKIAIRLVSGNNHNQDSINFCRFDKFNQEIFYTSCGPKSDECKIYTSLNCDQVHCFQSNIEDDGHVVFVIGNPTSGSRRGRRLIGFSNGVIKRISLDSLSVDYSFKVPMNAGEKLTCGTYSENGKNLVFGTNQGTLFIASMKSMGKSNRCEASYCRIENVGKCNNFDNDYKSKSVTKLNTDIMNDNDSIDIDRNNSLEDLGLFTGITNIALPYIDPIGTILISFDDGQIKLWQSSVKNEQLMKMLQLDQASKRKSEKAPNAPNPVVYDISEVGYQQFDLVDCFDLFQNPHGLEEITEADRSQLKALYSGKKYEKCIGQFAPGWQLTDQYFAFVDALQYIFIRNYQRSEIIKRISLSMFPTCLSIINFSSLSSTLDESSLAKKGGKNKSDFLVSIGTREGRVAVYRFGQISHNKMLQTKNGVSFGGITDIDIQSNGELMVATNECGEMMEFELVAKLNEQMGD